MKNILILASLFVSFSSSAMTPAEAIAYLTQKMKVSGPVMMGHSRQEFFECGIEFVATATELRAIFFYPNGNARDIRGVMVITPESKVVSLDAARNALVVEHKYKSETGTQKRTSRISFDLHADGSLDEVRIGWTGDTRYPIPMYGCVVN